MSPPARKPFKLGFFTHVRSASGRGEAHEELVRLFVGAEALGYDVGFVAQHLLAGGEEGSAPSPLISLAPVAVATGRIGLGVAVVTLPITDPVQLAEDALTLDGISRGRLQLGLGTGNANIDKYAAFGRDKARATALFDENLAVLQGALAGHPLRGTDLTLPVDGTPLSRRLWRTAGSAASARRAALTGLGLLFGTATLDARTQQRPIIDAYLAQWAETGPVEAPAEVSGSLRPRLGGIRMIYPADSRESALAALGPFLKAGRARLAKVNGIDSRDLTDDQVLASMNVATGSPSQTAQALRDDAALLPEVDHLIAVTNIIEDAAAGLGRKRTVDVALEGLERIAAEVAPRLGWKPER
ncbi:LLM class flavin-dependent oxidoreductase [Microbispora sp. SCL1-1]|uniref:LLM class flavin-dependent oxidoreductase n=1 Tax=unclassified Microbispora TaxID=2614687 RepID=UPI001156EC16|nr:LLM class flavin-dependent oxidoreductase [Microbispora sp. SCL1-1]NJP26897.1 LLM class flavin-dependent oxidoreductase [Microbispora sp. CL1-1]TQS11816.1 LLM class flavin-dependent oxidoreductase [Microbispora sp. SCL1-1]